MTGLFGKQLFKRQPSPWANKPPGLLAWLIFLSIGCTDASFEDVIPDSVIFMATDTGGLVYINDNRFPDGPSTQLKQIQIEAGLPNNRPDHVASRNGNEIYVGFNGTGLAVSTDAGNSFTVYTGGDGSGLPGNDIEDISASEEFVLITGGDWSAITEDGSTFREIFHPNTNIGVKAYNGDLYFGNSASLFRYSLSAEQTTLLFTTGGTIRDISIYNKEIAVATVAGVYYSNDGGDTWNAGLTDEFVWRVAVKDGQVAASTINAFYTSSASLNFNETALPNFTDTANYIFIGSDKLVVASSNRFCLRVFSMQCYRLRDYIDGIVGVNDYFLDIPASQ